MVEAGLGIGRMPKGVALTLAKSLGISTVKLTGPRAHRELAICVLAHDALPVAAKLLVDNLRAGREG